MVLLSILVFFYIILCVLVCIRPYWFIGFLPIVMLFTRFDPLDINASPEKIYFLFLIPALIIVLIMRGIKSIKIIKMPKKIIISFLIFWLTLLITQLLHSGLNVSALEFVFNYLGKGLLVFFIIQFINKKYKFDFCLKCLILSLFILVVLGFIEIFLSKNFFVLGKLFLSQNW